MDGGFLLAQHARSDAQREYVQARLRQRVVGNSIMSSVLVHEPPKLALSSNVKLGGLSVQHIARYQPGDGDSIQGCDADSYPARYALSTSPATSSTKLSKHASLRMDSAAPPRHIDVLGSSSTTTRTESSLKQLLRRPYQLQHGRRYIRDVPYPLPCDLPEIHRQNLRTQLACAVFGRPVCCPDALASPPVRVLEVGCGSAYWTLRCHEMFSTMGHSDVMYAGLDIAPVAPDLRKLGLNWTFVHHDMRQMPWPFDDESFDLVMCKDISLAIPVGGPSQQVLDECMRLLRVGGNLEIWESDHVVRSLQPHPPPAGLDDWEQKVAERTATFPMSPITPFAPARNRYLKSANSWIDKAFEQRRLPATPCTRLAPALLQEPDHLGDIGFHRVAIPLSELPWDSDARSRDDRDRKARSRSRAPRPRLNSDQLALRATALLTVLQMIESLEPILMEASGKNTEEWSYWWASMMDSLTTPSKKALSGECLEIGAWWATKLGHEDGG